MKERILIAFLGLAIGVAALAATPARSIAALQSPASPIPDPSLSPSAAPSAAPT